MKFNNLLSVMIAACFACNNANEEKTASSDSTSISVIADTLSEKSVSDTDIEIVNDPIQRYDSLTKLAGKSELKQSKSELNKSKIEIKTFQNTDNSGFGYDILMDGHMYVHQPNVPALPGNNGFASEAKAKQVAELVANKIRNNIMPPTVDVKELDSMGIK